MAWTLVAAWESVEMKQEGHQMEGSQAGAGAMPFAMFVLCPQALVFRPAFLHPVRLRSQDAILPSLGFWARVWTHKQSAVPAQRRPHLGMVTSFPDCMVGTDLDLP